MYSTAISADGDLLYDSAGDRVFPWWSFTKPVIATLILQTHDRGQTDLDATLSGWPFTLRQLLQHRSGLRDYGPLPAYQAAVLAGDPPWSVDRLLQETDATTLAYAPGTNWVYSNIGYLLLRQQLERLHGQDLAAIMRQHILQPLGLNAQLAQTPEDFARLHWDAEGYHPGWVYHGCLVGTAQDAVHLLRGLLDGHLLEPDTLRMMLTQDMRGGPIPGRVWSEIGYGMGMMVGATTAAGRVIGHTGGGPFSSNLVAQFPDLPGGPIVASFGSGSDESHAERDCQRIALNLARQWHP